MSQTNSINTFNHSVGLNNAQSVSLSQSQKYMIVEESDVNILKNAKLFFLILMFTFTSKDELFYFLVRFSKLYGIKYLQKYYDVVDKFLPIPHAQKHGIEFKLINTIEQHESGVNQIIKMNDKNLVTISDDCSMKKWKSTSQGTQGDKNPPDNDIKVDQMIQTETTTCLCSTGPKNEVLVAGCHSGNLNLHRTADIREQKTIYNAHQNLIRAILSLKGLGNKYFVSADVCGSIKVWPSNI